MNGARIRVVRQDLGLTVDTAAKVLGVDTTTMRRWETARSTMPPGAVADLLALVERSRALARPCLSGWVEASGSQQVDLTGRDRIQR